jgi:hypothetical protein
MSARIFSVISNTWARLMDSSRAGLIENGFIEGQNSMIDYSFC